MITATSTVHHNGAIYREGQEIPDLSEEQAAALVAAGAADEQKPPAKPGKPGRSDD
jgi:hypothetical protein